MLQRQLNRRNDDMPNKTECYTNRERVTSQSIILPNEITLAITFYLTCEKVTRQCMRLAQIATTHTQLWPTPACPQNSSTHTTHSLWVPSQPLYHSKGVWEHKTYDSQKYHHYTYTVISQSTHKAQRSILFTNNNTTIAGDWDSTRHSKKIMYWERVKESYPVYEKIVDENTLNVNLVGDKLEAIWCLVPDACLSVAVRLGVHSKLWLWKALRNIEKF